MDTGHWIVNATLSKLFKTFSSSNSGVSCWTSVPSWNRAGRLILPEPSCTISVLHRYLHSHLLHQASALFHTRSRPTFFLPRKEFDQPGLFGHRITCRRQLHLSNAAISNFEELAHKGFLCLMTISGNIKLCFIILGRGSWRVCSWIGGKYYRNTVSSRLPWHQDTNWKYHFLLPGIVDVSLFSQFLYTIRFFDNTRPTELTLGCHQDQSHLH